MKLSTKKITIVVVSYNSRVKIVECLNSIKYQNYPKNLIKTIVVDNNSSDSTLDYIKESHPEVKIIANGDNKGFATANNQGYFLAKKYRSDYLFLLNDDAVLEFNAVSHLVAVAEKDKTVGAVQAKLLLYDAKNTINSFGNSIHYLGFAFCDRYKEKDSQAITEPFLVPYPSGAASLIRMSALEATDLFDDRFFMYHEDVDLGWRLRLAGYKILFDPLAVVYHKYHYSKAKYKFYFMERNRWLVVLQNYRVATLILMTPALIVMELGQLLYATKNGWLRQKLTGYLWLLLHFPSILGHRLDVQFKIRHKKITDREILRLFVGAIKFQEVRYPLLTYVVNPLMVVYFWLVRKIIFW